VVTTPTVSSGHILAVGVHGDAAIRWFEGQIDDVRLSSGALYTTDFEPDCPNVAVHATTVGAYHFNEGTGSVAVDSSLYVNHGTIHGAQYQVELICYNTSMPSLATPSFRMFPTPATSSFTIEVAEAPGSELRYQLVDMLGNIVEQGPLIGNRERVVFDDVAPGCYLVRLVSDGRPIAQQKQLVL
jgi:hypothetical protein